MELISSSYCNTSSDEDQETLQTTDVSKRSHISPDPGLSSNSLQNDTTSSLETCKRRSTSTIGYISKRKRSETTPTYTVSTPCTSTVTHSSLSSYLASTEPSILSSYELTLWKAHKKPVLSLNWHPFHPHILLSSSLDGTISIWDIMCSKNPISCYSGHTKAVQVAQWLSPSHIVSGGMDKSVLYTDMTTMQALQTFSLDDIVTSLSIHPTNPSLFMAGTKKVQLWDIRSGTCVNNYVGARGQILDLLFINNGNELVASSDIVRKNASTQRFLVWDSKSSIVKSSQIYCEPYTCPCLQSHPYNDVFMAQSNANYIVLFNSKSPYKMNKYKRFESHIVEGYKTQFDINFDGDLVASASANGRIYVYDYKSTRLLKTYKLLSQPSIAVQWNHTVPSLLACSFWDGSLAVFQY